MQNLLKKIALLIIVNLLALSACFAVICTASVTGHWESAGTWSCGHVSTCDDEIVISAGITVTITTIQDYSACPAPMTLSIYGTLTFQTGKKLLLPAGSSVFVYSGGSITAGGGGGSSNLISIVERMFGLQVQVLCPGRQPWDREHCQSNCFPLQQLLTGRKRI